MANAFLIRDMAEEERPRERLLSVGAERLKPSELIAILLRTGTKGTSAVQIAEQLYNRFGSITQLSRASIKQLCEVKGIGRDKAIALKAAFTLAQKMAMEIVKEEPMMDSPDRIAALLRDENRGYPVETFQVVLLNTRRRMIGLEKISTGTLDTLLVHPREVFQKAIWAGASAIVLVHNHPSGDPSPSEADVRVTRDLIRAGQLLKIDVLDHIILGLPTAERPKDFCSLKELGFFYS